jgi:hypothetical protein
MTIYYMLDGPSMFSGDAAIEKWLKDAKALPDPDPLTVQQIASVEKRFAEMKSNQNAEVPK